MAGLGAAALARCCPASGLRAGAPRVRRCRPSRAASPCAPGRTGNAGLVARRAPNSASSAATTSTSPSATSCRSRVALNWRGLDGVPRHEPLIGAAARSPGRAKVSSSRCATPAPFCATSACSATARRGRRGPCALIVRGKRAGRGRSRRGASDRGLAAAAGRHRDRAGRRIRRTPRRSIPLNGQTSLDALSRGQ